ncbi:hypothetical protein TRICI_000201 [Trichomonascus ciferrii]|uniref:Uncharacterized protein n=1 Tax=Trichomonascus ciferrii TaxID=44093 RepID=A0A642VDY4_9ASCO|nr:hypothetical protein TRICI_000201 [Trichomonascus ciferrii]
MSEAHREDAVAPWCSESVDSGQTDHGGGELVPVATRILTEYQKIEDGMLKVKPLTEVVNLAKLLHSNHEKMDCMLIQWFEMLVQSLRNANALDSSYETTLFDDAKGSRSVLAYGEDKCFGFSFRHFRMATKVTAENSYTWVKQEEVEVEEDDEVDPLSRLTDGSKELAEQFRNITLKPFWDVVTASPDMTIAEAERMVSWFLHGAYSSIVVTREIKKILPDWLKRTVEDCKTLGALLNEINKQARLVVADEVVDNMKRLNEAISHSRRCIGHPDELASFKDTWNKMERFFDYMNKRPELYERAYFLCLTKRALRDPDPVLTEVASNPSSNIKSTEDILNWCHVDEAAYRDIILEARQQLPPPTRPATASKRPYEDMAGTANPPTDVPSKRKKDQWIDDETLKSLRRKLDVNAPFTPTEIDLVRNNIGAFKLNLKRIRKEYYLHHKDEGDPSRREYDRIIDVMLKVDHRQPNC